MDRRIIIFQQKKKIDHPAHITLNSTGLTQANGIEPIIASLPIKTVCCSPFKRAQETKDIVTSRLSAHHCERSLVNVPVSNMERDDLSWNNGLLVGQRPCA